MSPIKTPGFAQASVPKTPLDDPDLKAAVTNAVADLLRRSKSGHVTIELHYHDGKLNGHRTGVMYGRTRVGP